MSEEIKETRVFGPPGTGKTTYATKCISEAAEKFGAKNILVASFTKTAAKELVSREQAISNEQIGTLHAHCYRALGNPRIAEAHVKPFNEQYPHYALSGSGEVRLDDGLAGGDDGDTEKGGDDILAQLNICRARMMKKALWQPVVADFSRCWEAYKREEGLLDFQDLIDRAIENQIPPNKATIGIFDEAQDFTPSQLKLIRRWAKSMKWSLIIGDDDQASAPWAKILTTGGGWVSAEDIDPSIHRLASYSQASSAVTGIARCGKSFIKEKSEYSGEMHKIYAGAVATEVTHNHPSIFRVTESAIGKTCVYLMKKENSFRVGWCQFLRADGCIHLSVRCKAEGAEAAWILGVYESKSEASLMESFVAAEFGISTVIWSPIHDQSRGHYTESVTTRLFEMLGDHTDRAKRCLAFFNKDMCCPFYVKDGRTKHGSVNYQTATCNLFSEIMAVPVFTGGRIPSWEPIRKIERNKYSGPVYSFAVERDHTYIADGLITHNCLFSFTGATTEAFLNPPVPDSHKRVLSQSYRVPVKALALANSIISKVAMREPKAYRPRDFEGKIYSSPATWKRPDQIVPIIKGYTREGKRVMVLTSCSYMLHPLIKQLRDAGIPFSNIYAPTRGDWNPIRRKQTGAAGAYGRLCAYMEPAGAEFQGTRLWTPGQLASWTEHVKVEGNLQRGAKAVLKEMCKTKEVSAEITLGVMLQAFSEGTFDKSLDLDLEWFLSQLTPAKQSAYEFPARIYRECGIDGPELASLCTIGTVHSVKGAEADVVIIFPDLSLRASQAYAMRGGEQHDQIIRQFYVAVTRTRNVLILCQGTTRGMFFDGYK